MSGEYGKSSAARRRLWSLLAAEEKILAMKPSKNISSF
jgi:hypothetical protein